MREDKIDKKCCGNCGRLKIEQGEDGLPINFCLLNGKERFKNQMEGCLGWEKREL